MNYIIGVDVGGTKIDCIIAKDNGNILSQVNSAGGNPLVIGFDKAAQNILCSINKCNKEVQINLDNVILVLIGSTGVGRKEDADKLENELKRISGFNNINVTTDAHIALEGAFPNKPGCILIAGTGTIIYGKDREGNIHRVGGFGRLIGDQGGGYSIGKKGLSAVAKQIDGLGNETIITNLITNKYGIKNRNDLISQIYGEEVSIPDVAPLVIEAAQSKDNRAIKILDEESDELIKLINSIKIKMGQEKLHIAFTGSLIQNNNYYSNLLRKKIKERLPFVEITNSKNSPVVGAIILGKYILKKTDD